MNHSYYTTTGEKLRELDGMKSYYISSTTAPAVAPFQVVLYVVYVW